MRWFASWVAASLSLVALAGNVAGATSTVVAPAALEPRLHAFDRLFAVMRAKDPTTPEVVTMFERTYRASLAPLQNHPTLVKLKPSEIVELFNDAWTAQDMTDNARYVVDMELDLGELERTGHAAQGQYDALYDAFIGSRMFAEADRLRKTHPSAAMAPVPQFSDLSSKPRTGPTEIVVRADGRKLTRRDFNVDAPAQILVVASPMCHFAQYSLQAVANDPDIGPAFARHATWLVPPDDNGTPVADVARWNRVHPKEAMHLVYTYREWPMIDRWEMPTFYFLRGGKLVAEVIGWPRTGRKREIIAALRRAGLMPERTANADRG